MPLAISTGAGSGSQHADRHRGHRWHDQRHGAGDPLGAAVLRPGVFAVQEQELQPPMRRLANEQVPCCLPALAASPGRLLADPGLPATGHHGCRTVATRPGVHADDRHDVAANEQGWRQFFRDPATAAAIQTALQNNLDLRVAALNIDAYRAQYRIQRAELFPAVNAEGEGRRQRLPADVSTSGERPDQQPVHRHAGRQRLRAGPVWSRAQPQPTFKTTAD